MQIFIEKALKHLKEADYAGYFEEMDKIEMASSWRTIYAEHKSKFIQGLRTFDFAQQLEVFAKEVGKNAPSEPNNLESFKQELWQILQEKRHLGIVEILEKIDKNLTYEQYDRTNWVSINSKTSPIQLELLAATLVESTKSLIHSIH